MLARARLLQDSERDHALLVLGHHKVVDLRHGVVVLVVPIENAALALAAADAGHLCSHEETRTVSDGKETSLAVNQGKNGTFPDPPPLWCPRRADM